MSSSSSHHHHHHEQVMSLLEYKITRIKSLSSRQKDVRLKMEDALQAVDSLKKLTTTDAASSRSSSANSHNTNNNNNTNNTNTNTVVVGGGEEEEEKENAVDVVVSGLFSSIATKLHTIELHNQVMAPPPPPQKSLLALATGRVTKTNYNKTNNNSSATTATGGGVSLSRYNSNKSTSSVGTRHEGSKTGAAGNGGSWWSTMVFGGLEAQNKAEETESSSSKIPEQSENYDVSFAQAPAAQDEQQPDLLLEATAPKKPLTKRQITFLLGKVYPMSKSVVMVIDALCSTVLKSHSYQSHNVCSLALDSITLLVTSGYISGRAGLPENFAGRGLVQDEVTQGAELVTASAVMELLVDTVVKCSDIQNIEVQASTIKALLALSISSRCGIHEGALLKIVRSMFHIYLVSKSPQVKELAREGLLDIIRGVYNRMEAFDAVAKEKKEEGEESALDLLSSNTEHRFESQQTNSTTVSTDYHSDEESVAEAVAKMRATTQIEDEDINEDSEAVVTVAFASQFHTDGYLLFRSLCKLSAKSLPEDQGESNSYIRSFSSSPSVDPLAYQSKLLSLELLIATFEYSGDAFSKSDKFVYAIRQYLCVSLLKNCMSVHGNVSYLALKIFLFLVYKFKDPLKAEIEVFVANIFLRILESRFSSLDQKLLVVEALKALCVDPLLLTRIFLDYDCDMQAKDLYKGIVDNLTRLSQNSKGLSKINKQEYTMSVKGMEVLNVILQSMLKIRNLPGGRESKDKSLLQLDVGLAVSGKKDEGDQDKDNENLIDLTETLDRKRFVEESFEEASFQFSQSIKGGLSHFCEMGVCELNAKSVANFLLKEYEKLQKTQIGELLGKEPSFKISDDTDDPEQGGPGFASSVLHHYVNALDFGGMLFDEGIRHFLAGFRLPGEAQKIDRIMEKFAERYSHQNMETFKSSDAAFVLAFSVIMLNTDLHNPSIKQERKMTLEAFIRNNRGICIDGGDLPDELLEGIYSRIKENQITLKEDEAARKNLEADELDSKMFFNASEFFGYKDEKKQEEFRKEKNELVSTSFELMKKRNTELSANKATNAIAPGEVVRPMFSQTWGALLGALSSILERTEEHDMIVLTLNAFVYSVRIASHCQLTLARDTFIGALTKFTTLGSMSEIKNKNLECIRVLISIAIIDGDFLGESYGPVLQCISQLAKLLQKAAGADEDADFQVSQVETADDSDDEANIGKFDTNSPYFQKNKQKLEPPAKVEESRARAVLAAVSEVLIDKVFTSTVNLSARGIVHFIEQLIRVSVTEISGGSLKGMVGVTTKTDHDRDISGGKLSALVPMLKTGGQTDSPRLYCLQKLVEVADYNMDVRPKIIWSQMWEMMSMHFAHVGSHQNAKIAMYSIDALRQLSFKFLAKPELNDFNFQRSFLKPFEVVMQNASSREEIRELVLRCVDNMIRSLAGNLRSGWKVFFTILESSSSDPSIHIKELGIAILQRILDEHLDQISRRFGGGINSDEGISAADEKNRNADADDFVALCKASLSYMTVSESKMLPLGISMRALCQVACYGDLIACRKVLPPVSSCQSSDSRLPGYTYESLPEGEKELMVLWRPLLDGLAKTICSPVPSSSEGAGCLVQRGAIITMRSILLRHKDVFSPRQWEVIITKLLIPAYNFAANYDDTPILGVVSPSPLQSSFDFVKRGLDMPPELNDPILVKFAEDTTEDESAPCRPWGEAELLVEASFADLRLGGDGNLGAKPVIIDQDESEEEDGNEPGNEVEQAEAIEAYIDSWIANVASLGLGLLADIFGEVIFQQNPGLFSASWNSVETLFQKWIVGTWEPAALSSSHHDDELSLLSEDSHIHEEGEPCEALIRISCEQLYHIGRRLSSAATKPDYFEEWLKRFINLNCSLMQSNLDIQRSLHADLLECKLSAMKSVPQTSPASIFGEGILKNKRVRKYDGGFSVVVNIIDLEWGATLYEPAIEDDNTGKDNIALRARRTTRMVSGTGLTTLSRENFLYQFVPSFKRRATAAYMIQNNFFDLCIQLSPQAITVGSEIKLLLSEMEKSASLGAEYSTDEDLIHVFQEYMRCSWGNSVEEVERALTLVTENPDLHGSTLLFLIQGASAVKTSILILNLLSMKHDDDHDADTLFEFMSNILSKYIASEGREGHKWRRSRAPDEDVGLYCAAFSGAVRYILDIIYDFDSKTFEKVKAKAFPVITSLIASHSHVVRGRITDILIKHVAPLVCKR